MKTWSNTFRVGIRKVTMTYSKTRGLRASWEPDLPVGRDLTEQEWKQYRAGRDALAAEIAKELGGSVLLIET